MKGVRMSKIITPKIIVQKIFFIRGKRVMLDKDLAQLYMVLTKNLNKAVARNIDRFPVDFMIRLTKKEYDSLRFQIGTLKKGTHSKYLPYAFTEQGVAMLSSVLRSKRAIQVNVDIMRAFVQLREILSTNKVLAEKLNQLEKRMNEKDKEVQLIFEAIKQLLKKPTVPIKPKPPIGFHAHKHA